MKPREITHEEMLASLYAMRDMFGKVVLSEAVVELYWIHLQGITPEALKISVHHCTRHLKWFPKPCEMLEPIEDIPPAEVQRKIQAELDKPKLPPAPARDDDERRENIRNWIEKLKGKVMK